MQQNSIRKALICTNHLFMWAGSEMVAVEVAEELLARGITVDLHTSRTDSSFVQSIFGKAVEIINLPAEVDLASYDIVYAQHHVFQLVLRCALGRNWKSPGPFLIWNHLSPTTPLELPGSWVEAALADAILCNSPETRTMLTRHGKPFSLARVWPNPAPAAFASPPTSAQPSTLITVSNHVTPELDEAIQILARQGMLIRRVGQPHGAERLGPEHITAAGTVVTIGKTVQYALRAGRRVYCYGPHGGPGWLTPDTYAGARDTNFSGRCHPTKKDAATIANELSAGSAPANELVSELDCTAEGFALEIHIDDILQEASFRISDTDWQARRLTLLNDHEFRRRVALEANLCAAIKNFYVKYRNLERSVASGFR